MLETAYKCNLLITLWVKASLSGRRKQWRWGGGGKERKYFFSSPNPFGCGHGLSLPPSRFSSSHATFFPLFPSSGEIALCDFTKNACARGYLGQGSTAITLFWSSISYWYAKHTLIDLKHVSLCFPWWCQMQPHYQGRSSRNELRMCYRLFAQDGRSKNINGVHINFQNPSKCNKVECEPALLGGGRRAPSNPLPPSFWL